MQKTKLGVSAAVLGAAIYFTGLFSGYMVMILLAGYVLLLEDNVWLRKTAVKAVVLLIAFSAVSTVLGLIPSLISLINSYLNIYGGFFISVVSSITSVVSNIISFLQNAISLIKTVLFLILGWKAMNQGTIKVPAIDKLVEKVME
jgi:uncharacterized membrane protein